MEQKAFMNQILKFNQSIFNNTFDATVQLQDQVEKMGNTIMDQAGWLPGESRQLYDNCAETYRSARSNFKSYMDENYQQTQKYFT